MLTITQVRVRRLSAAEDIGILVSVVTATFPYFPLESFVVACLYRLVTVSHRVWNLAGSNPSL